MFATCATYHTTLQATPSQSVFGRDAILNTQFKANWKYIKDRKQKLIAKNNKRENSKQVPHKYRVGDKVLYKIPVSRKFGEPKWVGPYPLTTILDNSTVRMQRSAVNKQVNIRSIKPYFS